MDGVKKTVANSLQRKLSIWLSLAIVSMAFIAGLWSYYSAFEDAHDFQDDALRQIAILFDQNNFTMSPEIDADEYDPEDHFYVQLLSKTPSTQASATTKNQLDFPSDLVDGFQTIQVNHLTYRVFVKLINKNERLAVAQETEVRDEIAQWSSIRALIPLFILVPILLLVIAHLIRTLFKSVAEVTQEIDKRGEHDFYSINRDDLPVEIQPFVEAINRLLNRVEHAMGAQRRFVADAAHELRSPLTALSLQAERLANTPMPSNAQAQVNTLREGIARSRALLNQLLALARSHVEISAPDTAVSIQNAFRLALEDLIPMAEQKNIDIGITTDTEVSLFVTGSDLICIIKNLIDNAIRYTPVNGRVDLSAIANEDLIILLVEDSGPGIPEEERKRVFDPFYRVLGNDAIGSGLGLSIVMAIATRLNASVSFDYTNPDTQSGLKVMVAFPIQLSTHRN